MEIGTVKADKKLKIYTIKGKRVDREDFQLGAHVGEIVPEEASVENIKKAVDKALASNGKVCGIYQEKKLVGIYVFERIEDYFIEAGETEAMAGERRMESQEAVRKLKEIFEDSKAAMKLILWYLSDALSDQKNKIEDMIRNYMKGCMSDGFWAGLECHLRSLSHFLGKPQCPLEYHIHLCIGLPARFRCKIRLLDLPDDFNLSKHGRIQSADYAA